MNNFFKSCRQCLSPKVLIIVGLIIAALFIFVPIIGIASLLVALPLLGCTIMCGAMLFMTKDKGREKKQ